jgi:RNA polymerase sigma-B factor
VVAVKPLPYPTDLDRTTIRQSRTSQSRTTGTRRRTTAPRRGAPRATPRVGIDEALLRRLAALPADDPARSWLRGRVVEANLPVARTLARRYQRRGVPIEDLTQVAVLALLGAVDRYDPARGCSFVGYAVPSILGALRRHFRDAGWMMRVPRPVQELRAEMEQARGTLEQRLGHSPNCRELAAHLHVPEAEVLVAQAAAIAYRPDSLNVPVIIGGDGGELLDLVGTDDARYEAIDNHLTLRPLIAALPDRERRILGLRFVHGLSQAEIAADVGISQMHVSRLLNRTLTTLRSGMRD